MRYPKRRTKYAAVRTTVDGITFASKREAARYGELKLLERAGAIQNLRLQPRYVLHAGNGVKVCEYVADYEYLENGVLITEDCKGFRTEVYKLKSRHFKAEYGREIRET